MSNRSTTRDIRNILIGIIVGVVLAGTLNAPAANEPLADMSAQSLPALNDQLGQIQAKLANHEKRLVSGGL